MIRLVRGLCTSEVKTVVIVDGNNLLYNGFNENCTKMLAGRYVGAMHAFVDKLGACIDRYKVSSLLICFDSPKGKIERKKMDSSYKSTRASTPKHLRGQFSDIQLALCSARIPMVSVEGVEADDVIASYALEYHSMNHRVVIVSNDLDFFQTIQESKNQVQVYRPQMKKLIQSKHVKQRFGVTPEHFADFRALQGCKLESIKLPELTKMEIHALLKDHGSIDNIIDNMDKLQINSPGRRLANAQSTLDLAKQLNTLHTKVALPLPLMQIPELKTATGHEFKDLIKDAINSVIHSSTTPLQTT